MGSFAARNSLLAVGAFGLRLELLHSFFGLLALRDVASDANKSTVARPKGMAFHIIHR